MKSLKLAAGLVVALSFLSCTPQPPDGGDGNCNGICDSVFNLGGPTGATPSPSPGGGGSLPAGSRVAIFLFGQSCPANTTIPSNGAGVLLTSCVGFFTATPKGPDGTDLPAAVHGPNCAWQASGTITLTSTAEPFNRDGRCSGVGPSTLQATVKDVTGTRDFRCQTTAAGLTGGDVSIQTIGKRLYVWDEDFLSTLAPAKAARLKADAIERDQARLR